MSRLASFVTGRRSKWFVILAWIVAVAVMSPLGRQARRRHERRHRRASCPPSAESTEVQELLKERFPGGRDRQRARRLPPRRRPDRGRPGHASRATPPRIARRDPGPQPPAVVPFAAGRAARPRRRRTATPRTRSSPSRSTSRRSADWGKDRARGHRRASRGPRRLRDGRPRPQRRLRGGLRRPRRQAAPRDGAARPVLLGAIYRAPLIAVTPILVVGLAYAARQRAHLPATRRRPETSTRTRRRS